MMRFFRRGLCALLLLMSANGCIKSDLDRMENQIQLLDKRVELLQQDQEKANAQLLDGWRRLRQQLEDQLGSVQRSSAEGSTRLDDVVREMRTLSDRLERSGMQYQRLSEQLAALQNRVRPDGTLPLSGSDTSSDPSAGADTMAEQPPEGASDPETDNATYVDSGLDPELTYKAAYSDYAQGNFKLAIVNFETYVQQFPSSAKAVLAQYFIGESYYALGQYREAVAAFDKVITGWPGDEKSPVANLKKGYALLAMGQKALGMGVLRELINKYPNTHEALLARERLSAL